VSAGQRERGGSMGELGGGEPGFADRMAPLARVAQFLVVGIGVASRARRAEALERPRRDLRSGRRRGRSGPASVTIATPGGRVPAREERQERFGMRVGLQPAEVGRGVATLAGLAGHAPMDVLVTRGAGG